MKKLFSFLQKSFAIFLVLMMTLCSVETVAFAFESKERNTIYFEETCENQIYFNDYSANRIDDAANEINGSFASTLRYANAYEEQMKKDAAMAVRDNMIARNGAFEINVRTMRQDYSALIKEIFKLAISKELAETPDAGDYLAWQYGGYSFTGSATIDDDDYYVYTFNFKVPYYTTAAQEVKVTDTIHKALANMDIENLTEYQKIRAIYDYVCSVCNYDHNAKATDHTRFSAYGALIEHKAVCQGYATLLYRMLMEAGIDNKIVTSTDHSWNIVKLEDKYYNVDVTWDDNYYDKGYNYFYFLKCAAHFADHTREAEYKTTTFNHQYAMTTECYYEANTAQTRASAGIMCSDVEAKPVQAKVTVAAEKLTSVVPIANGITAKWEKVADAAGYQLQYAKNNKFTSATTVNITTASTVNKNITALAANTKYYLRVRAYKKANGADVYGSWSAVKNVVTPAKPKTVKLNSVAAASKAFTVKWTKQSGITGYQIQYSTKSNFSGATTVNVGSANTTSKKITRRAAKKKHYVRVRAYKIVNGTYVYGGWSTVKSVVTKK